MDWWVVLVIVIIVGAIIWFIQQRNARVEGERSAVERSAPRAGASEPGQAPPTAAPAAGREESSSTASRRAGLLQEAADTAAGRRYETATSQMETITADLAAARREADRAAERLAGRAGEALAAVQAAAAAHGGAVPGDGTHECPPDFPIKGNMPSRRYHLPGQPSYDRTIPEVCFQSAAAAEAAGFTESGDETEMRGGETAVAEDTTVSSVVDADRGETEVVVTEDIRIQGREDAERVDVVAEAIAAADAGGVPPGAIRGDGSRDCPLAYPIKGDQAAMVYHVPGTPAYEALIPALCFSSVESAETAGFAAAGS